MYETLVGDIPNGYDILHNCFNSSCANPLHLRAGTRQENNQDKDKGKLNKNDIYEIRKRLFNGETFQSIANIFKVSSSSISDIKTGKKWYNI